MLKTSGSCLLPLKAWRAVAGSCVLRTKARTAFKSWSRSESSADEILYRLSKSGYQRALRRPKCKAWADFRRRASFGDTFKALAEFSGKAQSIPVPLELVVDGLPTSDPAVIAEGCADHFFPGEKPTEPLHVSIIETSSLSLSQINSDIPQSIVIFLNCRFYSTLVHNVNYFVWVLIHKAILGNRVLPFNNNKKNNIEMLDRNHLEHRTHFQCSLQNMFHNKIF